MPNKLTCPPSRWLLTYVLLFGAAVPATRACAQSAEDALAQMPPGAAPPPQQGAPANPICIRLEGQLATIDRGSGSGDPTRDEQIRRYQDVASRQQAELDRVIAQARRMGCDYSGFF